MDIRTAVPIISFSFDDAPASAFNMGGQILIKNGARATFFVSLGMLGSYSPSGLIVSRDDILRAVSDGHELGCHTYDHRDAWRTPTGEFEKSVIMNKRALAGIIPSMDFKTFAYPISTPRPSIKRRMGKIFECCRGGGQTFNHGEADLNLLKAYFLDQRNRNNIAAVKRLIDQNAECRGWLIFASHDVSDNPSRYGCDREYYKKIVAYAVKSGALLLTIGDACTMLQKNNIESIAN